MSQEMGPADPDITVNDKISDAHYTPVAKNCKDKDQPDSSMGKKIGPIGDSKGHDDRIKNDPSPPASRPKKESKHADMNQIRKDGSAKESMTFGNIGNNGDISNFGNNGNIGNISSTGNIGNIGNISNIGNIGNFGNIGNIGNIVTLQL